jgi:hypothetical protein
MSDDYAGRSPLISCPAAWAGDADPRLRGFVIVNV